MAQEQKKTVEELEQIVANLTDENRELSETNDVLVVKNTRLRENLDLATQGLGLANVDSLPKEVAEDARRRASLGLPMDQAIRKALEQFAHNKKQAEEQAAKPLPVEQRLAKALQADAADFGVLRDELAAKTIHTLQAVIGALEKDDIEVEIEPGERNKDNIASAIISAVQESKAATKKAATKKAADLKDKK